MLQAETGLSLASIGEKLGRSRRDTTLGQIVNEAPDSQTGKPRGMGDAQARLLERAFGKPTGWMDRDPDFDQLLEQLQSGAAVEGLNAWPFRGIAAERWYRLPPEQQQRIEAMVANALELVEPAPQPDGGASQPPAKPRAAA